MKSPVFMQQLPQIPLTISTYIFPTDNQSRSAETANYSAALLTSGLLSGGRDF
jgi:hypothetical protein